MVRRLISESGTWDLFQIAKHLNVEIDVSDKFPPFVGGELQIYPMRLIVINANIHKSQQRFVIAHELGHIYLHKDYMRELFTAEHVLANSKKEDMEASQFAVRLLNAGGEYRGYASPCAYYEQFGCSDYAKRFALELAL